MIIREFHCADIESALLVWRSCEHIGLDESDSVSSLQRFLQQNPSISFIAEEDGEVVGAVLCGNDGRRGYLYHLAVHKSCRRRGIGRDLMHSVCAGLRAQDIHKCHIHIFRDNEFADLFWQGLGWTLRRDIDIRSKFT